MNAIIQSLNEFGQLLATWLLWMNGWTLAMLAAAILLDGLLARHVAARWRVLLYAAVFLRLALPVSWQSPLALPMQRAAPNDVLMPAAPDPAGFIASPQLGDTSLSDGALLNPSAADITSSSASITANAWAILPIAHTFGIIVLCIIWVRTRLAMHRHLQHATLAPRTDLTAQHRPPLYIHETFGPAVVGIIRPRIILPAHMMQPNNADDSRTHDLIIQHEHAHIVSGDHFISPLLQLIVILAWPIVPLWFAAARIRRLMELACDERAFRTAPPHLRRTYMQQLLTFAAQQQQSRFTAAMPLLGMKGDFAARLAAIATLPAKRRFIAAQPILVAAACTALLACSTTSSQDASPPAAQHASQPAADANTPADPIHLTDRTILTVTAWDSDKPFTDEMNAELVCFNADPFHPVQPVLPFQITRAMWTGALAALNSRDAANQTPFGKQLRDWLEANAHQRMLLKPGTKAVLNKSTVSFTFPHIASGGDDVERSELQLHLGETANDPVHFTYHMPDRPAREQFPRWHMTLPVTTDGSATLLAMPLANGGRRIILIERQPYIHHPSPITP